MDNIFTMQIIESQTHFVEQTRRLGLLDCSFQPNIAQQIATPGPFECNEYFLVYCYDLMCLNYIWMVYLNKNIFFKTLFFDIFKRGLKNRYKTYTSDDLQLTWQKLIEKVFRRRFFVNDQTKRCFKYDEFITQTIPLIAMCLLELSPGFCHVQCLTLLYVPSPSSAPEHVNLLITMI